MKVNENVRVRRHRKHARIHLRSCQYEVKRDPVPRRLPPVDHRARRPRERAGSPVIQERPNAAKPGFNDLRCHSPELALAQVRLGRVVQDVAHDLAMMIFPAHDPTAHDPIEALFHPQLSLPAEALVDPRAEADFIAPSNCSEGKSGGQIGAPFREKHPFDETPGLS